MNQARQKIIDLHTKFPCYKIEVVGHSLGGAVAEIIVSTKCHTINTISNEEVYGTTLRQMGMNFVEVITLASPRVGNAEWAMFVDQVNSYLHYR